MCKQADCRGLEELAQEALRLDRRPSVDDMASFEALLRREVGPDPFAALLLSRGPEECDP